MSENGSRLGEPLLTAREVAEWWSLSPSTILDWYEQGSLPGHKLGRAVRFDRAELADWLASQRKPVV